MLPRHCCVAISNYSTVWSTDRASPIILSGLQFCPSTSYLHQEPEKNGLTVLTYAPPPKSINRPHHFWVFKLCVHYGIQPLNHHLKSSTFGKSIIKSSLSKIDAFSIDWWNITFNWQSSRYRWLWMIIDVSIIVHHYYYLSCWFSYFSLVIACLIISSK